MKTKLWIFGILLAIAIGAGYLMFYPVPIDAAAWTAPQAPDLKDVYARNETLRGIQVLYKGQCPQCEDIAVDRNRNLYGSGADGKIYRFKAGNEQGEVFAVTEGRPLGLHFDTAGNLLVADAQKGLLSIDTSGMVTTLSLQYDGRPFKLTDDLETGPDGMIYFTDASSKFNNTQSILDLLEHRPNGRLLSYDPKSKQTRLLLDSLYFANGVAVSPGGEYVLVNETWRYQVRRYWLKGEKAGQSDIFLENLPGFPDGISQGKNGIFWVALVSPRNPKLDAILPRPFLRELMLRLPVSIQSPPPAPFSYILGVDTSGRVAYNLQAHPGPFVRIASIQEEDGLLYLGSVFENGVGVFDLKNMGRQSAKD